MFALNRPNHDRTVWYKPSKFKTWWEWILDYPPSPANWKGWLAQFGVFVGPMAATIIVLAITDVSTFWGMVTYVPLRALGAWIDWQHMPKPKTERSPYRPGYALRPEEV